jgi:hypothetical protein
MLDGRGSIPSKSKRFSSSSQHPDQLWGQPSLLPNGALSLGVKWQGCEAVHSPPTISQIENGGARPSLSHKSSGHGA